MKSLNLPFILKQMTWKLSKKARIYILYPTHLSSLKKKEIPISSGFIENRKFLNSEKEITGNKSRKLISVNQKKSG